MVFKISFSDENKNIRGFYIHLVFNGDSLQELNSSFYCFLQKKIGLFLKKIQKMTFENRESDKFIRNSKINS